jgi:eukaryotic-like serine/threonine-protein kinase
MGADAAAEEQFGPYLVYERLGVGGMATVHRALERGMEGFERIVALKRLLPHLAEDTSFIKSFVREAKLASQLNHNNIVHIFELGRVAAHYFISMEYIDGRDVRRILRQARTVTGPPPMHVTVGILLQLCDALDYAHHKVDDAGQPLGLVHRDVSPSNLLVTSAGQIKVIDFGIAKAQGAQRTQTGRVKGKLAYMAPEALTGKELDARSDLFAVGVIAHELLTARPLFASKNEYQTLMKVQRGEVMPPSTFNQQCPLELDAIVLRALARDPDQRFLEAAELRDDLHAMRKQYNLATTERDVAAWIDWAFRPDLAAGSASDPPRSAVPRPRGAAATRPHGRAARSEEDEEVDLAWGGPDEPNDGNPVVIDDVPDVSGKHLAADPSLLGAEVRLDLDDLADDIPTPLPSHGPDEPDNRPTMLHIPHPARTREPSQLIPVHVPGSGRLTPRPAAQDVPTPNVGVGVGVGVGVRSVMIPPRVRTITIPPRLIPTAAVAPRNAPATEPPRVPSSPTPPPPRAASPTPSRAVPSADPTAYESFTAMPVAKPARDALTTEKTPRLIEDDLGLAGDTVLSMPVAQSTEPIVRFREPTVPPPLDAAFGPVLDDAPQPAFRPSIHVAPGALPSFDSGEMLPDPATEPMASPPAGALDSEPPVRSLTRRRRLITPATALFAEPEPDTEGNLRAVASSGHSLQDASARPERRALFQLTPRRIAVLIAALVIVGATATIVRWYATGQAPAPVQPKAPPPPPPRASSTSGTIHFVTVPADAEITISGSAMHAGSPWDAELRLGSHQVEIHRDGYKGWLTSIEVAAGERQMVRVELAPLGSALMSDATLIVSSNPAGLDAVLDGVLVARTPIKRSIKPGVHAIELRRNGVAVWKKTVDAGAGTIYDLRPTLAEADGSVAQGSAAPAAPPPEVADAVAKPEQAPAPTPLGTITPTPIPAPPPAPPPMIVGPVSVAPSAVTKLSGPTPNVTKFSDTELPERISAKLCIDAAGRVNTAELLTPVASDPASEILGALRAWRYAPYKLDGTAHPACFAVAFHVK